MKETFIYIFSLIGLIFTIFILYTLIAYLINIYRYKNNIKVLVKKTPAELMDQININSSEDKKTIVYFGRQSCPFCRIFSKKLKEAINKTSTTVFYIQTLKNKGNESINKIRDKYGIQFVPTVIKIEKNDFIKYDEKENLVTFLKG